VQKEGEGETEGISAPRAFGVGRRSNLLVETDRSPQSQVDGKKKKRSGMDREACETVILLGGKRMAKYLI